MASRDPEIIKRDIQVADLSASNCAIQADACMARIDSLRAMIDTAKRNHDMYVDNKASFEQELAAALAEQAQTHKGETP
jgi:hypothetical protein